MVGFCFLVIIKSQQVIFSLILCRFTVKMSSKTEKDKVKQLQDKCQSVLNTLLRDEDNKYCVDCDSKGPRWASWNLGVFLCIRCAGIHRNLGVHISKVKSVNLDAWTPEQVVSLQQMGNSRARAVYEANLPDNFRRPQSDSSLESFIRAKYEHKKYIAREWVPPTLPKVNWEKEIEEEMEKQKRKKKTVVEKKVVNSVEVPQLPKPKNPSPKPTAVSQAVTSEAKPNSDLLGLQNGEEGFSGFVSAPTTQAKEKPDQDPSKSEEESFFNQTAPTEQEKVKLTKDSILALYSNTPAVNNFNGGFQNQVPFQQAVPTQNNFQNFTVFSQQAFQVQPVGPVQQVPTNPTPFQAQPFQNWGATATPTPNYYQMPPQVNQFAAPNQYQIQPNLKMQPAPNQYSQFSQLQQSNLIGPTPNPFCGSNQPASLQQQFSTLSVGNQNPANPTSSLTGHLWQ